MERVYYWQNQEDLDSYKSDYVIKTSDDYNYLVGRIRDDNGWLGDFIKLCKHYYEKEPCGGRLHIVLDDGNLEDRYIFWCAGLARGLQDHEGTDLANLMSIMTMKQRARVYNSDLY